MKIQDVKLPSTIYLSSNQPFKKNDFTSKQPIQDELGNYYWQVQAFFAGDRGIEPITITVLSPSNPVEGMEIMQPLAVKGLSLTLGVMDGKKYFTFRADSIKAA